MLFTYDQKFVRAPKNQFTIESYKIRERNGSCKLCGG